MCFTLNLQRFFFDGVFHHSFDINKYVVLGKYREAKISCFSSLLEFWPEV